MGKRNRRSVPAAAASVPAASEHDDDSANINVSERELMRDEIDEALFERNEIRY